MDLNNIIGEWSGKDMEGQRNLAWFEPGNPGFRGEHVILIPSWPTRIPKSPPTNMEHTWPR